MMFAFTCGFFLGLGVAWIARNYAILWDYFRESQAKDKS